MEARKHRISSKPAPSWDPSVIKPMDAACEGAAHTGVVFVHGVGFQVPGETLLNWSEPLIRMLREHRVPSTARADPTIKANLDFASGGELPFIEVDAPDDRRPRHWILAEAFWASSIEPPSVATVIDWLGSKRGATRAIDHLLRHQPKGGFFARLVKSLFVAGLASMLLVLYSVVRSILSLIPGTGLKETVIGPIDAFLTAWTGDMRTLLSDPAQSRVVRDRITGVISELRRRGCNEIVILAHSGGAVASYLALAERQDLPVSKLITFGEGLNIAFQLLDVETFPPYPAGLLAKPIKSKERPLRWFDYYASDDPVPAGALNRASLGKPARTNTPEASTEIGNRWSFRQDHGTYWENDEEFAIPVLRHIDQPVSDGADSAFYTSGKNRVRSVDQRYRRLGILGFWRSFVFAAAFAAIGIGSAGVAYHVYAKGAVEDAINRSEDPLGGFRDAWSTYWGRFDDPILGKTIAPVGGPIFDVGIAAGKVWAEIPGTELLSGPAAYIRAAADHNIVVAAVESIGLVLWPFIVALASLNALPRARWAKKWTGAGAGLLRAFGLLITLPLLVGGLLGVIGLLALGIGTIGAPLIAGLIALLVWGGIGALFAYVIRRRLLWRSWLLVTTVGTALCLGLAMIANRSFGTIATGSVIVLLVFLVIGSVGEWRWRARDEHERRAVRTGRTYRFPMWWDAGVGLTLLGSVVVTVVALAVGSLGGDPGVLLLVALFMIFAAALGGIQLDQYLHEA